MGQEQSGEKKPEHPRLKYNEVPTPETWLKDAYDPSMPMITVPVMQRIRDLIQQYHDLVDFGKKTSAAATTTSTATIGASATGASTTASTTGASTTVNPMDPVRVRRRGAVSVHDTEEGDGTAPTDDNLAHLAGAERDRSGPAGDKLFIVFLIERASRWVQTYWDRKEKLGGKLTEKEIDAVFALHACVYFKVKQSIDATDEEDFDRKILANFGLGVVKSEQEKDKKLLDMMGLEWFFTREEQERLKLSFRDGHARKWDFHKKRGGKRKGELVLYDTEDFGDAHHAEYNASLYVMDKNAIYVCGKEELKQLKHSSLLAGASVRCAGTIRIENGQVRWLTGKSGHYMPTLDQLIGVLDRLRQYQVDLTNVTVYRENYGNTYKNPEGHPGKHYEGCNALVLLKTRVWPGLPQYSKSLCIDPRKQTATAATATSTTAAAEASSTASTTGASAMVSTTDREKS